ncbi:hypothetical protein MXB_1209 [Myxobolus squamalis]|nr:hypothetical protein MXB_1209 [Myxobolus squamalis]
MIKLIKEEPDIFNVYQAGFRQQMEQWPITPLNEIIYILNKSDMGCGEAALSKSVKHKVFSFDFVAANETVEACDFSHVPLEDGYVDVVIEGE